MADMFTITIEHDRDEIIKMAQSGKDQCGDLIAVKNMLDMIYPAWGCDTRTSIIVELMFRDEDDEFYSLYTQKLAELDAIEGK